MDKQKIRFRIDKKGNIKVETLQGFTGTDCEATLDSVMACIGGKMTDSGDKDDKFKQKDASSFVSSNF